MTIWKSANNQSYFDCDIMPVNSQVPINFYQHYGSNIGSWATACYNCASWEMSIYTSSISYAVLFIWDSMPNTFAQNGTDAKSYIIHDTDTDKYIVYMGGGYGYTASEPISEFPNWRIAYPEQTAPQAFKDYVSTPIITYQWLSVPAISGKNGILSLTMIKDEKIEEGSNQHIVLPDDNISRFTDQSNIRKLCLNHISNDWFIAGESGLNRIELKYRLSGPNNDIMLVDFRFINHYGEGNNQYYSEVYSGSIYYSPPLDGSADAYFAFIIDDENEVAQFDPVTQYKIASATPPIFGVDYGYLQPNDQQMAALYYFLKGSPEDIDEDDPYADGSEGDGGDGNPYQPQDHLGLSSKPTKSGLNLGLVTLYNPSETELAAIAQFLWSDDTLENFKKYFNNFADNLMALYVLPVTPDAASKASKVFKVGNLTSESSSLQSVDYITDRYADIDMGAFYIKRKWDSYLDVSPYTKLEIYLPYCGTHQLNTDEIMYPANQQGFLPTVPDEDIKLELNYRIDLVTGNIVATLFVNGENRYQFTGKCGMSVPLTGANYNNMVQGALTAGAGLAATIASGGLTAPLTASAAVSGTVMAQKPEVYRSGNLSGDVSMLGFNTPYLIKTIPNKPALSNQEAYTGYPSYKKDTLSAFSGYTEVIEAHIDNISCTDAERDKIMTYLKGGVII